MRQDLRYAWRTLSATPGFTLAAILSLALGIGANSAIFSVASALLLRPLPYQDADRLTILWNRSPGLGIVEDWFSTAQYFDIKHSTQAFDQVAIIIGSNVNLTGDGEPERIGSLRVSANLLPMLGVTPVIGRLFTPEDERQNPPKVAVLNYGTWMRRYGGDGNVIGKTVVLNGVGAQIIGVLPEWFTLKKEVVPTLGLAADAEILVPQPLGPEAVTFRGREDYNIVARLKHGVTVAQAQAEMDALTARLRQEHPDVYPPNGGLTFSVVPLHEQVVGDVRPALLVLVGAVGCVLLIACANVANLLLSRAVARQKEIAVRAALGASRTRIVQQLLTESLLLALAGGGLGLAIAYVSVQGIHALGVKSVPRLHEVGVDWPVLAFTIVISCLAGVLFGLAPALRLGRVDVHSTLKDEGRGASGGGAIWARGANMRRVLVIAELAISVMVLIGAGLLIRSFARLQDVSPGFDPRGVMTAEVMATGPKYANPPLVSERYRELWQRLSAISGVTAAGGVSALPLSEMMAWGPITVEGRVPPPGEKFINADQRFVGGDYFRAMSIPIRTGRGFNEQDTRDAPRVAIVDEYMASQLWPGTDALGKRLRLGGADSTSPWITVVGIAGRVKQDRLDSDSRIAMYFPHTQFPTRAMNIVVKSATSDAATLGRLIREEIRAFDRDLPVYNMRTMESRVAESLARRRFAMLMLTFFAALALGLAAIGTYGVIAYLVSQGTRELGIRLALGATPHRILGLIVRHGLTMGITGVMLGLIGALVLTRFMQAMLFAVDATDPVTFVSIALLLTAVAFVASVIPARRAARIDPMVSLRSE